MILFSPCLRPGARRPSLRSAGLPLALAAGLWAAVPRTAMAIPLFNRQTGQNCVACHAGGQFPELTPYGRLFKLTGYTLGQRTVPVSAMAVASLSHVANTSKSADPAADFQKNDQLIFATASVFLAGKITDNLGAFAQFTYDPYATQSDNGSFHGATAADNIELRYADRFIDERRDLIFGASLNNNPSLSDPWNTAPAWMQYVPVPSPTSSGFIDGSAPYPGYAAGGNIAGLTGYAYWNRTLYGELGAYGTSRGALSFMHAGVAAADNTRLRGLNPYWRLAWTQEWGAHNLMLGTSGMVATVYDDPLDTSSSALRHHDRDLTLDAQYQYLLDPHSVTGQLVFERSRQRYQTSTADGPALVNAQDNTSLVRAKATYVYRARYGSSLSLFDLTGTVQSASPATRGWTYEAFVLPLQYLRIGVQYTGYGRYGGAATNYDGLGRNASDNNSLFLYMWAAY